MLFEVKHVSIHQGVLDAQLHQSTWTPLGGPEGLYLGRECLWRVVVRGSCGGWL